MLVKNLAALILGMGLIGLVVWKVGGAEIISLMLVVALPLLALGFGAKLISGATLDLIYAGKLKERVGSYMDTARQVVAAG